MSLTSGELASRWFENVEYGLPLFVPAFAVDETVRASGQLHLGFGTHIQVDGLDGLDPLLARIIAFAEQQIDGVGEALRSRGV